MGEEDKDSHLQKQRDALAHSKSVVQRPPRSSNPSPANLASTLENSVGEFITYPEFAPAQQTSLAPLLSLRRLLLLVYLSTGATVSAYVVAKLFLQPLLRRVVTARREFHQHVNKEITKLTQNLSGTLIRLPLPSYPSNARLRTETIPTIPNTDPPTPTFDFPPPSPSSTPENLSRISTLLTTLTTSSETTAHNELSFATEDLLVYLNNQIYTSAPFGGYGFNADDAKNDIINKVKTDIRSVKGAVLNMYFLTRKQ